jgi:hypothetical protein
MQQPDAALEAAIDGRRLARRVIGACLAAEVLFVVLDYQVNYGAATSSEPLRHLANLASEDGLASWFASAQTLLVGLTLWAIRALSLRDPAVSRAARRGWLVLACLFTWMAFDDGAQIHERLGTAFDEARSAGSWLEAFPSYAWQILLLPPLAAAAAAGLALVWRPLSARRRGRIVLAGLACLALAVVLDFFEGLDADHPWNLYARIARSWPIEPWTLLRFGASAYDTLEHFSKSVEEYLEMLGHSLLWLAFLRYLVESATALRPRA